MPLKNTRLCVVLIAMLLPVPPTVAAQKKDGPAGLPAVIWRDPGDMTALNLIDGAGGKEDAPNPNGPFTFVKEDAQATSPKFDVTDGEGVRWRVKLGQEPQSETAATRFLWAAGYFVDEDYYLPQAKIIGLPKLQRGANFTSPDGTVRGARFERRLKDVKDLGLWDWFDNPFLGTQEFNGLRVMMSLLNNWDLSVPNNSIYGMESERRYVITDVGATFGNTGNSLTRSKSAPKEYADSAFIEHQTPGFVDFVLHSRPFVLSAVNVPNYRNRTRMEQVTKHIPRADAKWLGQRLSLLSGEQIRDGFRAAGYSHDDVEVYAKTLQKRIAELAGL